VCVCVCVREREREREREMGRFHHPIHKIEFNSNFVIRFILSSLFIRERERDEEMICC
jgi:hypothetical protein